MSKEREGGQQEGTHMRTIIVAIGVRIKMDLHALHCVSWKRCLETDGEGAYIYISTGSCVVSESPSAGKPPELST